MFKSQNTDVHSQIQFLGKRADFVDGDQNIAPLLYM